jgi:metal-responsive CopG/Arc/MetJ family transcriptional regulator
MRLRDGDTRSDVARTAARTLIDQAAREEAPEKAREKAPEAVKNRR